MSSIFCCDMWDQQSSFRFFVLLIPKFLVFTGLLIYFLQRHIYGHHGKNIQIFADNSHLAVNPSYVRSWLDVLSHTPRVAPFFSKDDPFVMALKKVLLLAGSLWCVKFIITLAFVSSYGQWGGYGGGSARGMFAAILECFTVCFSVDRQLDVLYRLCSKC